MKTKTATTLSGKLLNTVDKRTKQSKGRGFSFKSLRDEQNAKDLEILNRRAKTLNREAIEVLSYQAS